MSVARLAAIGAVVALLTAGLPCLAVAAPSAAARESRHRFDEGEAQYRAGHYAEALAKYQAGYAAVPLPGFLINIAQCQRRLGDLKAARASYREFVLVAPDSRLVPEVEELIKQLDDLIADLDAGGSGEKAAEVGGASEVHTSDLDATAPTVLVAPAPPPAAAPALIATPVSQPVDSPPPAKRSHARWWIWGGIAVAAVAGGVATAFALSSPTTTTVRAGTLGTLSR
jgi:hypothetical protein